MNLVDMARRRDRHLRLNAGVVCIGTERWRAGRRLVPYVARNYIIVTERTIEGVHYRGFDLSADERTGFVLSSPLAWHPFRHRPAMTGWALVAIDRRASGRRFEILLRHRHTGQVVASRSLMVRDALQPVEFPAPPGPDCDAGETDLEMKFPDGGGGRVFLAVHRILDRSEIISLCRGNGVELGPGPSPQVLPDDTRDVLYVEQSSPERWDRLYNEKDRFRIDKGLWKRYTIGEAYPLPVEDDSLDFIFSSHVFEHLANPLGHLRHWYTKLRTGGVVVGVVPDIGGSKDYVFEPCPIKDLLDEDASGEMQPQISHYRRWAAARAPGKDPAGYWEAKRSIHVHFYSGDNMNALLNLAVGRIGYKWFRVWYTPNHKDFFFAVGK